MKATRSASLVPQQRPLTGNRLKSNFLSGYVDTPYDHFPFQNGLEHWLARHNKYSHTEVELVRRLRTVLLGLRDLFSRDALGRRRCFKRIVFRVWFRPTLRFVYTCVFRKGFRDMKAGYIHCRMMAQYEFQLLAKLAEKKYRLQSRQ